MSLTRGRSIASAFSDLSDDLAVEIDLEMRRRGLRVGDLADYGYSVRHRERISAWLRGSEARGIGVEAALLLAERLNVPVRCLVGAEARELAA